jgi:hypothetical protein
MESLMTAAQDKALNTRYHQKNIMRQPIDSTCRTSYKAEEHIKHIVAGCITLAPSEYNKDTISWVVTFVGRYINIWGYRLPTSATNVYLKGS